jgi:pyruvate carboxylase
MAKLSLILLLFLCGCHFQLAVLAYNGTGPNVFDYDSGSDKLAVMDFDQYWEEIEKVYSQLFISPVKAPAAGAFDKWGPK